MLRRCSHDAVQGHVAVGVVGAQRRGVALGWVAGIHTYAARLAVGEACQREGCKSHGCELQVCDSVHFGLVLIAYDAKIIIFSRCLTNEAVNFFKMARMCQYLQTKGRSPSLKEIGLRPFKI